MPIQFMGMPFAFNGTNTNITKMLLFLPSIQNTIKALKKEKAAIRETGLRTSRKEVEPESKNK